MGYRLTALTATAFCLVAGLVFTRYHERKVLGVIGTVTAGLAAGRATSQSQSDESTSRRI